MKILEGSGIRYEVNPCPHCKKDDIKYSESNEPWNNEHWYCSSCDSTYPIFDEQIARPYEDIFNE